EELAEHGHQPRLENASGSLRFDIANGRTTVHWFVRIHKGDVAVSRSGDEADCTIRASRAVFDRLASGQASAVAAVLRGTLSIEGDWRLLVLFRRILPGLSATESTARPRSGRSRG
ncbi:MAG TPA: SCP2 sterol-binding domain-containing protein, partial [Actinomycetota bacterium]